MSTMTPSATEALIRKLAAVARCPAATGGEAANATAILVKIAGKNHFNLAGYEDLLAKVHIPEPTPRSTQPNSGPWNSGPPSARYWGQRPDPNPYFTRTSAPEPQKSGWRPYKPRARKPPKATSPEAPPPPGCMPFGPYKGMPFEKIIRKKPGYLSWLLQTILVREPLRGEIVEFLNSRQKEGIS